MELLHLLLLQLLLLFLAKGCGLGSHERSKTSCPLLVPKMFCPLWMLRMFRLLLMPKMFRLLLMPKTVTSEGLQRRPAR